MKKIRLLSCFVLLLGQFVVRGQDFSNKGKDFWLGYGYHVNMAGNPAGGGTQDMILYFTSDKNANVTVTIPGVGYTQTYTVTANQVTVSNPMPKTGAQDARINAVGIFNRGIHVTSDVPIVAYAHIYNASVSGASLLFPTNTLGKDYYSINYTQSSNAASANSFFFVVATEDNTTVEITPSAANLNGLAVGLPTTVTLNTGQIYNVMGTTTGTLGTDLTGSRIRSISSNGSGGCKKIAVFSGAGKMSIGGSVNANGTADNLFAQAFPAVAWGKRYLTAPTGSQPNNFYRICVTDTKTVVKLNGTVLPVSSLVNGFYYQFKNANALGTNPPVPNLIESDIPILVAQYCTTQGVEGNPTGIGGDPEMIYLSPVEQTINNITLFSASLYKIVQSYINVIIKNGGVASFKLDGVSVAASFSPHPQDNNYSYATFTVASGSHSLYSDTGFNAIAYGFGAAESYGYNAGTNIRDFTPIATFQNPFNRIDSAVTCINTPLQFSVPLSFVPSTIQWDFSKAPNISPSTNIGPLTSFTADSVKLINGLTLNYYSTHSTYTFSNPNTIALRDTIKLYTTSATPDGCGSTDQTFAIPVTVKNRPSPANFTFLFSGCLTDSVKLTDQTPNPDGNLSKWFWDFGDGTSSNLSSSQITPKLYSAAGNYSIKLKVSNDIGCASDSVIQPIQISTKPIASFTKPAITCVNNTITFTDASTIQVGTIAKWVWNLDNGAGADTVTTNAPQSYQYTSFGPKDVKLMVQSSSGCNSDTFRINPQFIVNAIPQPGFIIPEVCLNDANAQFTDTTKIADGSTNLTYLWNFNAGSPAISPGPIVPPNATTSKNPSVTYKNQGNYKVSVTVTSNGCVASLIQDFTVNGANPVPAFQVLNATGLCSNDSVRIQNKSTVDFGSVTRLVIYWDAADTTLKTIDENPAADKIYAYKYPDFQSPATKSYSVTLKAFSGNALSCNKGLTQVVTVNASPKVSFVTMPGICKEASSRQITEAGFDARVTGSFVYTGTGVSTSGLFNPQTAGVGTFPIKFTYTSNKGCTDTATKPITVWPSPVAVWSVVGVVCQKNDIVFTDSSKANYSNIIQRKWDYGDGTATITRTDNLSYTRQFDSAKTYNVSLQVFTDSGCMSTVNVQPVKVNYLPIVRFNLPSICLPDGRGQFMNHSLIGDSSMLLFSYLWSFNDPNDPTSSTLKDPVHKYSATGPYNVKLKVTTKDACTDSLTQTLTTIYPQPKADFTATPTEICIGDLIQFNGLGNGITSSPVSWVWDLANGTASALQNPQKQFTDSGLFNISYYFFNAQGCVSDTAHKPITVYAYPKLILGPSLVVLEGGVVTIKPQFVYGTGLQYLWIPALYLDSDTSATPRSSPANDITYKLFLTGKAGCMVSDTIFIKVLRSPEVPNVFSPNGDGTNDTWRIKYLESYPGAMIDVYNRYGQLVFHSVGYSKDWDGTYNGKPLPVGTYYYIINPKNGKQIMQGSVTILK